MVSTQLDAMHVRGFWIYHAPMLKQKSPNVVKACEYANSRGVPTIAFVGFKGGKLRDIARHCVWIPIENYGMAEDAHQSLMHVTTQYIMAYSHQRMAAEAQCD